MWFFLITFICFGGIVGFFLLSFIGSGQTRASCMLYVSCATEPYPDSKSHFFSPFILYNFIRCMSILPICVYVFCMRGWCLGKSEEGFQSSETVVIADWELQYWCCESNLDPLPRQQVLWNTVIAIFFILIQVWKI